MTLNRTHLWWLLVFTLLLRLFSLVTYPLMDTTEARYGEMARLMIETGNWLTPQFDYNVPFWGKPPLFTWMSAFGIEFFGLNEFAVRAPHWLAGIFTLILMAYMAHRTKVNILISSLVLATCGVFLISAGAVMTDMILTLSVTIAMLGFYFCWENEKQNLLWGYFGFIGLGIGLLAKGPIAIVLVGIAVLPWIIIQYGFRQAFIELWRRIPIISGSLIMLAIALPWYLMAEKATPGFLDYFIVGEHFKRFVISGWEGDLYGSAHDQPRGMIWIFWLYAATPWSVVLPILLYRRWKQKIIFDKKHQRLFSFLICWLISPMILFSLAGNILPAYVLPGIPAIGLLITILINNKDIKWLSKTATICPTLLLIAIVYLNLGHADLRSDQIIHQKINTNDPIFYVGHRPFSGQFYSNGKAKKIENTQKFADVDKVHLIGRENEVDKLIQENNLNCSNIFTSKSKRALFSCQSEANKSKIITKNQ